MALDNGTRDSTIELQRDDEHNSALQFDAATYVAAKIFGEVALPLHVPFAKAAAINAQANFAQVLDTAGMTIGGVLGGPLDQKTREERQKERDDAALD